jgi:hypothetical protein
MPFLLVGHEAGLPVFVAQTGAEYDVSAFLFVEPQFSSTIRSLSIRWQYLPLGVDDQVVCGLFRCCSPLGDAQPLHSKDFFDDLAEKTLTHTERECQNVERPYQGNMKFRMPARMVAFARRFTTKIEAVVRLKIKDDDNADGTDEKAADDIEVTVRFQFYVEGHNTVSVISLSRALWTCSEKPREWTAKAVAAVAKAGAKVVVIAAIAAL